MPRVIDTPKGKMTITQAAKEFGIKYPTLRTRVANSPPDKWFEQRIHHVSRNCKAGGDSWKNNPYYSLYRAYQTHLDKGHKDVWGSYKAFKQWSLAAGWEKGMVLYRGNWYPKGYVIPIQPNNKPIFVEIEGHVYPLGVAIYKFTTLSYHAVYRRIRENWQNILYDPLTGFNKSVKVIRG